MDWLRVSVAESPPCGVLLPDPVSESVEIMRPALVKETHLFLAALPDKGCIGKGMQTRAGCSLM